ncbi:MAG: alpha/beta fold hydrolase [Parachlamydiaceae bacterium]|nr:alpha/beta fold hydrolase [Parachlamydiaceae bacterium]
MSHEKREFVTINNDGQQIYGMLHLPKNGNHKCPAILTCHGFAGNKIGRYRIYVLLAQKLAEMGIATLRIDFRGSGESEGDFAEMTVGTEVSDALKGLEFLRNHPQIDAGRIGLLGNSFGGAVAVLSAKQDKSVKSLALLAALFSSEPWHKQWEMLAKSSDERAQTELARILEGMTIGPKFYQEFRQLNVAEALKSLNELPLLHIHSEKDNRVSIEQAQQYEQCRQGARAETRYIRLQQCEHDFSHAKERAMVIEETAKWFSQTL